MSPSACANLDATGEVTISWCAMIAFASGWYGGGGEWSGKES